MPVIIEAEDIDGNVYQWVSDSEMLEKLHAHMGEPDSFLVADSAA
jgi:hypothetical protein